MFTRYARVVINLPLESEYTYRIPPELEEALQVGMRVEITLRGKAEEGIVTGIENQEPDFETLPILKAIDPEPIVTEEQIALAFWMATYYLAGPGECLYRMFPPGRRRPEKKKESQPEYLKPAHQLNEEQKRAFDAIVEGLDRQATEKKQVDIHLLHGITGAGKTEVYIHLLLHALQKGKGAILLVPEISLTLQLIRKLQVVFGNQMALLHSAMPGARRFASYILVLRKERRLAIGTRSAIFTPVENPGLIIIDEEHDSSYKEHKAPRYDARQIALKRAADSGAVVVLGSATPRIESTYFARSGNQAGLYRYFYHRLDKRATGAALPTVKIIKSPPSDIPFSPALALEIDKNLKKKEQTILLLNRRGYAPFLYCESCGKSVSCPSCSVTLTLHRGKGMVCHYCGYREEERAKCPECGGSLKRLGSGTQKLEEYLLNLQPNMRLERIDTDSVSANRDARQALDRLVDGELDVLLGTQMIAKGIDAKGVTLVGVLQADHHLGLPDFRASERTFALLTQVAGRAGRSSKPGRVIFEALRPEEKILAFAADQDYDSFYAEEIELRRGFRYPPFARLVRVVFRAPVESDAQEASEKFADELRALCEKEDAIQILGPVPPPLEKLNQQFRRHIIIKTTNSRLLREYLLEPVRKARSGKKKDVYMELDFDPVDLL